MTKAWILWIGLLCLPLKATSAPLTEGEVIQAAQIWLARGTLMPRPNARVSRAIPFRQNGEVRAWILELSGGGVCVSGADDLQLPVHLYRPTGSFDPEDAALAQYLQDLGRRLVDLRGVLSEAGPSDAPDAVELQRRRDLWQRPLVPRPTFERAVTAVDAVALPLNNKWHQGWPYNADCPELGPYGNTYVGCVATSLSQLLHYWKWPDTGTGSYNRVWEYRHSDLWISTALAVDPNIPADYADRLKWESGRLKITGYWDKYSYWTANAWHLEDPVYTDALLTLWDALTPYFMDNDVDFSSRNYAWDRMGDEPDGSDAIENQAVAQLCYDASVSVDMQWGIGESYSGITNAASALVDYWRYDTDLELLPFDYDTIVDEIRWGRPLQISGVRVGGGGHSFVISGYDATTTPQSLVVNLGSGGGPWLTAVDDMAGFTESQTIERFVAPVGVVRFVGGSSAGDGSPNAPYDDFVQAAAALPSAGTLVLRAEAEFGIGTTPLVLTKPMTLKSPKSAVVGR